MEAHNGVTDLQFHLGLAPDAEFETRSDPKTLLYTSSYTDGSGNPALRIWNTQDGSYLHVVYYDGVEFWLDRKRESVWATWPETSTLEGAASYLLGPVLGLLLRLRGVTCLHASAVAIEDRGVVFVGPEGAGKSTTAALFARDGYGVLSDDIVPLVERQGVFHVLAAYPHLCLWPDSVKMLYGSQEALPRFIPDWDKRCLALGEQGTHFESRSLPLGAIYVLSGRGPEPAPYVVPLRPKAALLALVGDTYGNKLLDRELRAKEFMDLSRVVESVPVRQAYPHHEENQLEGLCRVIREDFASLELSKPIRQ